MHYLALACDYDGTLATHGKVSQQTINALEQLVASGRKLLMVTGRYVEDLQHVFPCLDLFTTIVAENGAVLYDVATASLQLLGEKPPQKFLQTLQERGVAHLSAGHVMIATLQADETTVLEVISEMGLECLVIPNKGAIMILPDKVDKGTGMEAALRRLMISPHNVVGIGDAENDSDFLIQCGCAVAVANALPEIKELADYTTQAERGDGVAELIEQIIRNDLQGIRKRPPSTPKNQILPPQ